MKIYAFRAFAVNKGNPQLALIYRGIHLPYLLYMASTEFSNRKKSLNPHKKEANKILKKVGGRWLGNWQLSK